jgi:hypothetical protein
VGSTAASVAGSSVLILGFLVGVAGAAQTDCADSGVPARWLGGCLPASISNDIETGADNCVSVAREAVAAIYVNVFDDADTGDSDEFRGGWIDGATESWPEATAGSISPISSAIWMKRRSVHSIRPIWIDT